ncbi:hypothetical protein CBR_g45233 [Chara braunii]|uniref:Uncharacterized protein n=1 Tax=Chara braunii TaxID=69332 RepID=A0A388K3C2_CHABU|nr:hypothetical protein CBR_g45233 [Chara braunii]|eukprot:GBG64537.1 hypothetical protein CBR_g45233 [Chara braunii]
MTGLPGQLANEPIANYEKRFQAQLAVIEAEEQRQLAVKAAQLQAEEAATAEKLRLQAEADADAQARRKEAQDLLLRHEADSIERLKYWHFEPNGDEPTPEEQHREFMAKLVTRLVYTCNHLQSELANLQRAVRNHKTQHEDATRALDARVLDLEQAVPGPDAGASSSASSSRQLEERVDHVVAMLGDISAFTEPATISQRFELLDTKISQQQQTDHSRNNSSARPYKMSTFRIEKFDDYTHQDPVVWWQGFTTELGIHEVPDHLFISALFINTKGGCQIWLSHMATIHGVQVSDLYKKVSWEDMTKEWKKRFIVDDAPALVINRIFTMAQGSTPTRDWLTDWQKIVAAPDLDLPFPHLRREFYNRSCAALSLALGDREQYSTFAEIIYKARELIKTNRAAAHEKSTWQPTYVEKVRTGPRQQQFAVVHRSLEEHVEHMRTVLERLRQAKYKANRDKCEFAWQELEYLGHYVTPQGIRPLADKIEALRVWPEPTNTTEEFALEQDVSRKLLPKWFGPWSVTAAAGDEPDGPSFVINIPEHLTVHPVFHASKLATYTPAKSDDFPDRRSQDPPSMDGHQEVDRVITDRKYGSKPRQYKVTFKACDRDDTRSISGADLKASAPLIYAHYESRRLAQEASRPAPPTRTVVPPSDRQLRPRR